MEVTRELGEQPGEDAATLMMQFAARTGLTTSVPPKRYLWTDAFAVCNFLGLARGPDGARYEDLARRLIDSVHKVLGRDREDMGRTVWLSGLSEEEGRRHPTSGGLRIGKAWPERGPRDPYDPALEWNRDGQYFHYLTRWMHALDMTSVTTGEAHFNRWARELAKVAHRAFTYQGQDHRARMFWKMSIDLTRPLVSSMGHHDPLDGYVTYSELQTRAEEMSGSVDGPDLEREIAEFAAMMKGIDWTTTDSLGIGGLLVDALRIAQLRQRGRPIHKELLQDLLFSSARGLKEYVRRGEFYRPADTRLAFRELGLCIGLHAVKALRSIDDANSTSALVHLLDPFLSMTEEIEQFWLEPGHQQLGNWIEHQDINDVMLATCLDPSGYLGLVNAHSSGV